MTTEPQALKKIVAEVYAARIVNDEPCEVSLDACGNDQWGGAVYDTEALDGLPQGVISYGCGNPIALAALRPGDRVLDLGSGAGLDCFLAARQVGSEGRVIGVDFTPEMLERARASAAQLGAANVEFREGDIEALPLDDASVDVVLSNCVINLAPDKDAVFREAFRVLAPGGRLMVSDILLTRPASDAEQRDLALLAGCISGSLPADDYVAKVTAAGFADAAYKAESPPRDGEFWFSAAVWAEKPIP